MQGLRQWRVHAIKQSLHVIMQSLHIPLDGPAYDTTLMPGCIRDATHA